MDGKDSNMFKFKEDPVGCMGGGWRVGVWLAEEVLEAGHAWGQGRIVLSFSRGMRHIGMWTLCKSGRAVQGTWPGALTVLLWREGRRFLRTVA